MAEKKKTLFVSDIHMGAHKGGDHDWDWFSKKEVDHLIGFLKYVTVRAKADNDIKELVLLGDIFDLWVCPYDEVPHTFCDIIKAQKEVIDEIKKIPDSGVKVFYVNGNHDYQVTSKQISRVFGCKVKHIGDIYRRGNILAEHGHRHALFNCPDPRHGGYTRLPLGYYLTRLHTSLGESRAARVNLVLQIIDESFQVLGPEQLAESVLDALKDAVERQGSKEVKNFTMGHICADQSYECVRDRYKNLYDDWKKDVGFWKSTQMLLCEVGRLGAIADQLCRDGIDIVVFGHSHNTKMDKDTWLVKDRIYANCGYWCGYGEEKGAENHAHFVETDGKIVKLCAFRDGKAVEREVLKL